MTDAGATRLVDGDVVVIGAGVAGLTVALDLAPHRVTVLTKAALGASGASPRAQGGIAAAIGADDSAALHARDTLDAGAGLTDPSAAGILASEGPDRILELVSLGAHFEQDAEGRLALGREAAHSRHRIVHANDDATGAEVVRALTAAARAASHITVEEHTIADDLLVGDGRVVGVLATRRDGSRVVHSARAIVLATGGAGHVYAQTTNPPEATGDGLALAARAGAVLADLEFVQFHPTALDVPADPLPLVTEALRGKGATLVNDEGHRFMLDLHGEGELAPRDVVARRLALTRKNNNRATIRRRRITFVVVRKPGPLTGAILQ